MTKLYLDKVKDGYNKGWLKVISTNGNQIFLPYGILAERINSNNNNETLNILEGIYKNTIVIAPLLRKCESYFSINAVHSKTITNFFLDKSKKELSFNDLSFPVICDDLLEMGTYTLWQPDYPHIHPFVTKYEDETKGGSRFASTWFRLVSESKSLFKSNSYFHFGTYSMGCITFPYIKLRGVSIWNHVVLELSNSRHRPGICGIINVS
jgi:hypothetical protein